MRGTITLHYGDVPRSTWSSTFNFVQEANIGVRLCKNFWIDGGFFRTHVGTEGLFPKENITSSVAVPTYFEPYYEAGFRFNYSPTDKLALYLYLLNGYNLYEDNNKHKSAGILATYSFNEHLTIGYDNYIGDDTPLGDTTDHLRFYNNAFINFEKNKLKIVGGVDFGIQQNSALTDPDKSASMVSGLLAARYMLTGMFDIYARAEIFDDPDGFLSGVIIDSKLKATGLKLWGGTVGVEWKPTGNSYIKVEARELIADSDQEIFYWDKNFRHTRMEAMLNLGVWFP